MSSPGSLIERSFAITQELTHVGSWEWSPASDVVAWSDELYRIYGLEPQSRPITADYFLSCVVAEDREMVQAGIAAALEKGGQFRWSERIRRPDGSIRVLDTVGQVYGERADLKLFGTCRDVTDERAQGQELQRAADIFKNVQIGLSVWDGAGCEHGADFRLLAANPLAQRISEVGSGRIEGRTFADLFPYARDGEVASLLGRVAREQQARELMIERSRNPEHPNRALSVRAFPLPGSAVGLAVLDVTEQTVVRRLQSAEHAVLTMVASGAKLADSLEMLVRGVEEHSPRMLGSVLLLDHDGMHLRHGAGPNLPDGYKRAIEAAEIGPAAGSCGTAVFLKQPVFTTDIASDPRWELYRAEALRYGLRACWSIPISSSDRRVLGTFAFYYREPREPTQADRELAERASRVAAIAIEHAQMEEKLRDLSAHVEAALEAERTRIAREIHDDLGQSLTALKMDIAWLSRHLGQGASGASGLAGKLAEMSSFTDGVIQRVRSISSELRPGVLDDLGLVPALEWQAQVFEQRTGKICGVLSNQPQMALEREVATAAFRIFQEALTNVVRHAEAERVDVRVDLLAHELLLEVRDDGVGISGEAALSPKSLGLVGIRERAQRLGGRVTVEALPEHGTRVELRIPLRTSVSP